MFLSFVDETHPDSLIVTAADHASLLDDALFRRFDAVIAYAVPDSAQALDLLRERLGAVHTAAVSWNEVASHVKASARWRLSAPPTRLPGKPYSTRPSPT
jgi:SpoVK/Ycf46/Vps4 family AAA+-type ATPase